MHLATSTLLRFSTLPAAVVTLFQRPQFNHAQLLRNRFDVATATADTVHGLIVKFSLCADDKAENLLDDSRARQSRLLT